MRYYDIAITSATATDGAAPLLAATSLGSDGVTPDPGALQVEFDVPIATYGEARGQGWFKLYGVSLATISQANNYTNQTVLFRTGMSKGLPLANPSQSGPPVMGTIFQAFGNYQGTDQTLDVYFNPYSGTPTQPANFAIAWRAGTPLSTALTQCLTDALPALKVNVNISPNLVLPNDEVGFHLTMAQLTDYLGPITKKIIGGTYPGIQVTIRQGTVYAYDVTAPTPTPKQLLFTDLIGQPTWLNAATVQVHTVMRGDIFVGDLVTLPLTQQTSSAESLTPYRNKVAFSGTYQVNSVRLVGNFRQPSAESWVTVIDMVAQPAASGAAS